MWKKIYLIETPSSHNRCAIAVICACEKWRKMPKLWELGRQFKTLAQKVWQIVTNTLDTELWRVFNRKAPKAKATFAFSHPGWEGKWGCICLCLLPPQGERLLSRKKGSKTAIFCADFENLELKQCNVRPLRMNKSLFQEKTSKDKIQYRHILTPTQVKNRYNVT